MLDGSRSVTAADRKLEASLLHAGSEHTPNDVSSWQVAFAGGARAAGLHQAEPSAPQTGQTDLAGGLALAGALLPGGGRVTLATDGRTTRGDALGEAAALRARGMRVDVLPLASPPRSDVGLTRLAAPATARQGDTVRAPGHGRAATWRAPARSRCRSTARRSARRSVKLAAGDTPLLLTLRAGKPAWHRYHVAITAPR